eukprot:TRINITY_DN37296_c0_g1_i1.p1 TRINITY_DN37296_c0_g1~~TRINITY_DN37296_c0_g1_i1.p1  ORF type:complete len:627 (-),score=25.80 TRINITY_DN37296_c0_g1_i1:426-2306(-)
MSALLGNGRRRLAHWWHSCRNCIPSHVYVAFPSEDAERAFTKQLAPFVARWTISGHAVAVVVNVMIFIWNMVTMSNATPTFSWDANDFRTSYFAMVLLFIGIQCLFLGGMVFVAYSRNADRTPWELISIVTTAILVMVLPWLNPWHAAVINGLDPVHVWSNRGIEEYEALRILAVVSITNTYALYVPVRWRFSFIVPCCCAVSSALLFVSGGSPFPMSVPFKMVSLLFLLFAPVLGQRSKELLMRERWKAVKQVYQQSDELCEMKEMSEVLCDITFKLSSSFRFVGVDVLRDSFFGQQVEGTLFLDLLSPTDRRRFSDVIARLSLTQGAVSLPITVTRRIGSSDVNLFIVQTRTTRRYDEPRFLVSLTVSRETVRESPTSVVPAPPAVPQVHAPLPDLLGAPSTPDSDEARDSVGRLPEHDTHSEVSFTYSESVALTFSATRGGPLESIRDCERERVEKATNGTQTDNPGTQEVGTITTFVVREDTFTCTACARPPRLPGPVPRPAPPRGRRRRRQREEQRKYEGYDFDGSWMLCEEDYLGSAPWLRRLLIDGADVILGDLTSACIEMGTTAGETSLCGGKIWLEDGSLFRKGQSGRVVRFSGYDLDGDGESTADDDLCSLASFPA